MCNAVSVLFLSSYSRFILCYPKNVKKIRAIVAVIRKFGTMFKRKIKGEVVMLKGKKKALAAQVLLGLMVAGNAYAADIEIKGDAGTPFDTLSEYYAINHYNKNDKWYLVGDNKTAIITNQSNINGKNILISAGGQDYIIWDGAELKNNTITFGSGTRNDNNYGKTNIQRQIKIAKNLDNSTNNTIILKRIGVKTADGAFLIAGNTDNVQLYQYSTDNTDDMNAGNSKISVPGTALSLQAGNLELMEAGVRVQNVKLADTLKINSGHDFTVDGKLEAKKVDAAGATLTVNGAGSTVTDNC